MTTGVVCTPPILQFTLNNGQLASGGSILTQIGGVNAATYQDSALTTPMPNPIPLNSRGEVSNASGASSQLFLTPNQVYTFTLFDSGGNTVWIASYVNGVQVSITQAIVGAALYPQTAIEISVGASIVNSQYAPGNVLRYGINNLPGVTDMTAAIQTAMNVASFSGGFVYIPTGVYAITNQISTSVGVPIRVYGDGAGCTNILQKSDNHVFSVTLTSLGSRLIVDNLRITPAIGSAMATGRAINVTGTSGIFPPRSLIVDKVVILGNANSDEFKYGIWANGVVNAFVSGVEIHGIQSGISSSSVGIHIESTPGVGNQATAWDIVSPQIYSTNIGIEIATSHNPGVEGISILGGNLVGVNFGVVAVNSLGLAVYAPPQIVLSGTHINSNNNCVDLTAYVDVLILDCFMLRGGSSVGSFMKFSAVQNFIVRAITVVTGSTDVPVFSFDGTVSNCANGEISGFFQGKQLTTNRVVTAVGTMATIRVRGEMNAYAGWIPAVSAPGYTGNLLCSPKDVSPLTADEISVTITPSGGVAGGGTLDLTFVQSPYVVVNATAGTITSITPYGGSGANNGQRVTLECDTAGVVLQHNANQLMPGAVNFTYIAGATIDLYRTGPTVWRSVGRQ